MREVLGGCLAKSEGDGYDVLDRAGRKWEVRSVSKGGMYFCPSYMVGSGRRFNCDGFLRKLNDIHQRSPTSLDFHGSLIGYLLQKLDEGPLDAADAWIRMVAVNRLTGHSPGFFSVYTLPPNQAVSVASQEKINAGRNQIPPRRNVPNLIVAKSGSLLADCNDAIRRKLEIVSERRTLLTAPAASTAPIESASINLVVTSPPFLDVVDYAGDNWLRCWFCGIDPGDVKLTILKKIEDWRTAMTAVFTELNRVLTPGGFVAFEVGEVRGGRVRLEEHVIPCGIHAGLHPLLVLINSQEFTKTAACWGVDNNRKGTNTNRIVLFRKPVAVRAT